MEIRLNENPTQAEALHLLKKYMNRAIDFEQAKKSEKSESKIVDCVKAKKLTAIGKLLPFHVLPVKTIREMQTVAELWKFWRMEHLKHTTGKGNKISVAILVEAGDVIR